MKTIVLNEPGRFTLTDTSEPEPLGAGEALVRVRQVGICGTDIHAYRGTHPFVTYPRILGHELGVDIVDLGPNTGDLQTGDRCAVEPYLTCGECSACRRGRTNCCGKLQCIGVHTDGGMRELIKIPAEKLHRGQGLEVDQLALIETLSIGKHAVDRSGIGAEHAVAVLGLGPIGFSVVQFATLAGASVMGLDVSGDRVGMAASLFGIETLQLDPARPVKTQWMDRFGDPPLVVFDATGNLNSMKAAFDLPENGGTLVFVGVITGDLQFNSPEFHRKEMMLLGSRNATGNDFGQIINWIQAGRIDVGPWITHRDRAESLPEIFSTWIQPGARMLKGMISF